MARSPCLIIGMLMSATLALPAAPRAADPPADPIGSLTRAGKFTEALTLARQAAAAAAQAQGLGHADALAAAHRVGQIELLRGDFRAAEGSLVPALAAARRELGDRHAVTARLANDLGVLRYQQARYQEARPLFAEALATRTTLLGEKDADTLQSLRNLGWAKRALGDHATAQKLFLQCYQLLEHKVREPGLGLPTGAEAVVVMEATPHYPLILLYYGYYAGGRPPAKAEPTADKEARAAALDRLVCLQTLLGLTRADYAPLSRQAHAEVYGAAALPTTLAQANADVRDNAGRGQALETVGRVRASLGDDHPLVGTILRNLAISLTQPGDAPAAEQFLGDALALRRAKLGEGHPTTADVEEVQGIRRQEAGQYEQAQALYERVLRVRLAAFGDRHPATAAARAALGVLAYYRGDYARARATLEAVYALRRQVLGDDHPDTAATQADLAALAKQQGDYATARRLLEAALATLQRAAADAATRTRRDDVGNNLCVVQMEMGDYAAATRWYRAYLEGARESPYVTARVLINLGSLARAQGDLAEARKLFEEALQRQPQDPIALNNLGAVCRELGQLDRAEEYLGKALELRLRMGTDHPDTAFTLTSLGLLRQAKGDPAAAVKEFERALAIFRARAGTTSVRAAEVARLLGTARLLAGDAAGARQALEEAVAIKAVLARDVLPALAEADALAFISNLKELGPLLSALEAEGKATPLDAYAAVWATRGLVTRTLAARRRVGADTPETRPLADRLHQTRKELAQLLRSRLSPPPARGLVTRDDLQASGFQNLNRARFEARLLDLNAEKERCERELARLSEPFRRHQDLFAGTPADLARRLPADTALVDLVKVARWGKGAGGAVDPKPVEGYEAFVVRRAEGDPGYRVAWRPLGPAAVIDQAVQDWRGRFARAGAGPRGLRLLDDPGQPAQAHPERWLRERVWEKIAPELGDCRTVLLVPDGALARVPFAALPGARPGTFLLEDYAVATVSFPQVLPWLLGQPAPAGDQALLVGGIAYDAPAAAPADLAYPGPADAGPPDGWSALPGTAREVAAIAPLHADRATARLTGGDAGKAAVCRQLGQCRYVHLATHGYFTDPALASALAPSAGVAGGAQDVAFAGLLHPPVFQALTGRNPLVLSGLVLAGANAAGRQAEGVLTGEEIVDLDLRGAELVVLSACETGLGTVAGGEGVFGLQRAFGLAGARTTVASLWQVDDAATQALMVEFYRNLWQRKLGKLEALRQAQIALLRGRLFTPPGAGPGAAGATGLSPYFWAAFVLAGDWR